MLMNYNNIDALIRTISNQLEVLSKESKTQIDRALNTHELSANYKLYDFFSISVGVVEGDIIKSETLKEYLDQVIFIRLNSFDDSTEYDKGTFNLKLLEDLIRDKEIEKNKIKKPEKNYKRIFDHLYLDKNCIKKNHIIISSRGTLKMISFLENKLETQYLLDSGKIFLPTHHFLHLQTKSSKDVIPEFLHLYMRFLVQKLNVDAEKIIEFRNITNSFQGEKFKLTVFLDVKNKDKFIKAEINSFHEGFDLSYLICEDGRKFYEHLPTTEKEIEYEVSVISGIRTLNFKMTIGNNIIKNIDKSMLQSLNKKEIENIDIKIPSLEHQSLIIEIVNKMDYVLSDTKLKQIEIKELLFQYISNTK